jgi:hypothetical protein
MKDSFGWLIRFCDSLNILTAKPAIVDGGESDWPLLPHDRSRNSPGKSALYPPRILVRLYISGRSHVI